MRILPFVFVAGLAFPLSAQVFGTQQVIDGAIPLVLDVNAADLDGDGDNDVFAASIDDFVTGNILWYENVGDGSFGEAQLLSAGVLGGPTTVEPADFDGDGDVDVLAGLDMFGFGWFENDGSGTSWLFHDMSHSPTNSVYPGDIDGDGDLDIVVALTASATGIYWYENMGSGAFGSQQTISPAPDVKSPSGLDVKDLDGDGDFDVLALSKSPSGVFSMITWHENLGRGQFGSPRVIESGLLAVLEGLYAVDLDGDGDADVLSSHTSGVTGQGGIIWYENLGSGSFGPQQAIGASLGSVHSIYPTDINEDGYVDVLVGNDLLIGGTPVPFVLWFENLGGGAFGSQQLISLEALWLTAVFAADLDGDGDNDALSASRGDETLAWYENLTVQSPWLDLGHALAGLSGEPVLTGSGTIEPGTAVTLTLGNARAHMPSYLVIGTGISNLPCLGGVMVPSPGNWAFAFTGSGGATLEGRWPPGMPSGVNAYLQWWVLDTGGPEGFAASNALKLTGQ